MTKRIAIISVFILILINFKAHSSNIVIDHLANQEVFFGIDSIANTYNNKPAFDNNKSNSIIYTKVFITREARTRYFRVQYIRGDVGSRWEAVTITAQSYLNAELEALVLYRIPEEFRAEFWNRVYGGRPTIAGLQPTYLGAHAAYLVQLAFDCNKCRVYIHEEQVPELPSEKDEPEEETPFHFESDNEVI